MLKQSLRNMELRFWICYVKELLQLEELKQVIIKCVYILLVQLGIVLRFKYFKYVYYNLKGKYINWIKRIIGNEKIFVIMVFSSI